MNDEDWQIRARAEEVEVATRVGRLEIFRSTAAYRDLPRAERDRLTAQLMFMRGYLAMLHARLDAFP